MPLGKASMVQGPPWIGHGGDTEEGKVFSAECFHFLSESKKWPGPKK